MMSTAFPVDQLSQHSAPGRRTCVLVYFQCFSTLVILSSEEQPAPGLYCDLTPQIYSLTTSTLFSHLGRVQKGAAVPPFANSQRSQGLVVPTQVEVWASLLVTISYSREKEKEKGASKSGMYNLSFHQQGGGWGEEPELTLSFPKYWVLTRSGPHPANGKPYVLFQDFIVDMSFHQDAKGEIAKDESAISISLHLDLTSDI